MAEHSPKKSSLSNNTLLVYLVIVGVVIYATVDIFWRVVPVPDSTPVIHTSDGPVQGNIKFSRDGQEYWQFLGIPYAMPPVGALKFQPPVPVMPWDDVKQVTSYPPDCLQFDYFFVPRVVGEMDCLFLNVFVNAAHGNATKKPVLAYVYGGGFVMGGSRLYHPDYFMDRDVVLVVMNYRLGPYGFLNLQGEEEGEDVPQGNMGLKDQNLALQWIQKNIAQFGGDPEMVTLFGESAGAAAVHFHVLSSESRGLFQRAIVQSCSALSPSAFSNFPRDVAMEHATKFGCPSEDEDKNALWNCYKSIIDERDVVRHQNALTEPVMKKDAFEPTVDGAFLKTLPQDSFKDGESLPKIPIMFGVNAGEGVIRTARFDAMPELISKLDEEWADLVAYLMVSETPVSTEVAMAIRQKYFNTGRFVDDVEGFKRNLTLLISDSNFYYPEHKAAVFHAKLGSPTYMYYFNYTSKVFPGFYSVFRASRLDDWLPAFMKLFWATTSDWVEEYVLGGGGARKYGVGHGEGIVQLFNVLGVTKWMSFMDLEFSQGYIDAIVDFANDTKPLTFRGSPWPSINDHLNSGKDEYTIPYMLMDSKNIPIVISEPFGSRMKFWANLRGWDY